MFRSALVTLGLWFLVSLPPPYGVAILVLWLGTRRGAVFKELARGARAVWESRARLRMSAVPAGYEDLNDTAREYYLAVYGGGLLPRAVRWMRLGLAGLVLLAVVAVETRVGLARAGVYPLSAAVRRPWETGCLAVVTLACLAIVASFWAQQKGALRAWGESDFQGLRRCVAETLTKPWGGPREFRAAVTLVKGERRARPPATVWIYAPYWPDGLAKAGLALLAPVLGPFALVIRRVFIGEYGRLGSEFDAALYWAVALLAMLAALYNLVLVATTAPAWCGLQAGEQYFPLQVMDKDLQNLEVTSARH